MKRNTVRFRLMLLALTPLTTLALDWKPQPFGELTEDCMRFAETNGFPALAERLRASNASCAWIPITLDYCEQRLKELGPREYRDPELRRTLRLLDYPLHVDNYSQDISALDKGWFVSSVVEYQKRAIARVLKEAKEAVVPSGSLRAWHVYNMAYVLKGPEHTVLIDFTPYPHGENGEQQSWTDDDWQALAELGDILVITHPHRDHTSYPLMKKMYSLGKKLVLPSAMMGLENGGNVHVLDKDHAEPVEIGGVRFWNFMGFQGDVPCNTYLMEIDGIRVADNGDNSPKEKEWNLAKCPPADMIISSTWSWVTNIVTACQAAPGFENERAMFLPSHDNEVMHSVSHRESYREMYESWARLGCPGFRFPRTFPLGWGESVTFRRRDQRIPACPDRLFLEFTENGDRKHYEKPFGERLRMLDRLGALEESEMTGDNLTLLNELLREIAYERTWVMPAHDQKLDNFESRDIYIDLGSGMRAASLARALRRFGAVIDPEVADLVRCELRRRIFDPYLKVLASEQAKRLDKGGNWWYNTGNNWNAVCHSCVVRAAIDAGIPERDMIIAAALRMSRHYLAGFADDGYCSEGMGYWNYGFGYYLRMGLAVREATDGKVDFFAEPKWRRVMEYAYGFRLDAEVSPHFADGGGNPERQYLAMGAKVWPDLVDGALPLRTVFPVGGVVIMRSEDGGKSLAVAVKGGNNDEFHNHNDLGSFALLIDGKVVAGDPGGEVYTRRTFSLQRYESKVLSSYAHPVPVVGGALQGTGKEFTAKILSTDFTDGKDRVVIDLTKAYPVKTLKRLERTFVFDRTTRRLTIRDEVEFTEPTSFEEIWIARDVRETGRKQLLPKVTEAEEEVWQDDWSYEKVENPGRVDVHRYSRAVARPVLSASFELEIAHDAR